MAGEASRGVVVMTVLQRVLVLWREADGVVVVVESSLSQYINMTDGNMLSETCTVSPHCRTYGRLFFLHISCAAIGAFASSRRSSCRSV